MISLRKCHDQPSSSSLYDGSDAVDAVADAVSDAIPDVSDVASSLPDLGLSIPSFGDGDPPIAIIAGVGIVLSAAYALLKGGGGGEGEAATAAAPAAAPAPASPAAAPAPAPAAENDVSVPYDAAARLAYCNSKGISAVTDEADFQAYKIQYEATAVAEATAKKAARDAK